MNETENFLTIEDLSSEIDKNIRRISKGEIQINNIDALLQSVRELEERLVMIKYKAMEKLSEKNVEKSENDEQDQDDFSRKPQIRFTINKKSIVPKNQISLIDAIEEIKEEEENAGDTLIGSVGTVSLGQKMREKSIDNLSKAIKLNTRVGFIKNLFNKDSEKYNHAIDKLDSCANISEANKILSSLQQENQWDVEDKLFLKLSSLIERRHSA